VRRPPAGLKIPALRSLGRGVRRFERIAGFGALRRGMRRVEATVQRRNGRWVALEVERSGGGGEHGGDDNRRGGGDD
jgi:hypothetical protein